MKIIIKRDEYSPEITIDLSTLNYPGRIRDALKLALLQDGYTKETIADVFHEYDDNKKES